MEGSVITRIDTDDPINKTLLSDVVVPLAMRDFIYAAGEISSDVKKVSRERAQGDEFKEKALNNHLVNGFCKAFLPKLVAQRAKKMMVNMTEAEFGIEFPEAEKKYPLSEEDKEFVKKFVDKKVEEVRRGPDDFLIITP